MKIQIDKLKTDFKEQKGAGIDPDAKDAHLQGVYNSETAYLKTADDLKKVRYWIDCGDDDFLIKGNCLLHIALTEKNVPHEFRVRDGAHNWTYWRTGITDALQFIGDSFHQK